MILVLDFHKNGMQHKKVCSFHCQNCVSVREQTKSQVKVAGFLIHYQLVSEYSV